MTADQPRRFWQALFLSDLLVLVLVCAILLGANVYSHRRKVPLYFAESRTVRTYESSGQRGARKVRGWPFEYVQYSDSQPVNIYWIPRHIVYDAAIAVTILGLTLVALQAWRRVRLNRSQDATPTMSSKPILKLWPIHFSSAVVFVVLTTIRCSADRDNAVPGSMFLVFACAALWEVILRRSEAPNP